MIIWLYVNGDINKCSTRTWTAHATGSTAANVQSNTYLASPKSPTCSPPYDLRWEAATWATVTTRQWDSFSSRCIFCRFLLCFKANRKEEWDALHAPVEVGQPPKILQGTGVRRKQQSKRGKKKMSRVKSAREKKGEDTAEKVRGETIDLAAFEYVTAAGSWQQDFEKHSLTNAPLWQMPDVSHHFPAFQFMVCWHTQESYFSTEGQLGPRMPVHIGLPSAGAARAQCPLASRELYHAGLQFATWIPDKNCLLRKVFEEAFIRAFQASYTKSNTIKSADGFFNTRQMLEACCTSLLQPRCWPRDFHAMLQHQLHL